MGGKTSSAKTEKLANIQIQTSSYGLAIPKIYGTTRVSGNLVWYGNFKAIAEKNNAASGGKGFAGGAKGQKTYRYTAAVIMAIGEGPVSGITSVWRGKDKVTLASLGLTLYSGQPDQGTWPFLSGYNIPSNWSYDAAYGYNDRVTGQIANYSDQRINYSSTAYLAAPAYDLGDDASVPNHGFEVVGTNLYAGQQDASPADIIVDMLSSNQYGISFPSSQIAPLDDYQNYCVSNGLFVSPAYTDQSPAADRLKELTDLTNSAIVWSGGLLKIIPYGDEVTVGNGKTYTPNLTPSYQITEDDLLHDDDGNPIKVRRISPADAKNRVTLEFRNRLNQYNTEVVSAEDQDAIQKNGLKPADNIDGKIFCLSSAARMSAQLVLQRALYNRNTYLFSLNARFCLVEPMDILSLNYADLINVPVRVTSVTEIDNGFEIEAEDLNVGVASAPAYSHENGIRWSTNANATPQDVESPYIFELPADPSATGLSLGIAVGGKLSDPLYGGCTVWVSYDGSTYRAIGTINGSSRYGTLTSSYPSQSGVDSANNLNVSLISGGQLISGTSKDAENGATLMVIDKEFVAHQTATLTGANSYTLRPVNRGLYRSNPAAHSNGSRWARIDQSIEIITDLDVGLIGKTVYVKCTAFNAYGGGEQDLADAVEYSYQITGWAKDLRTGVLWSDITGAGKPQDNATVGAPAGTLVGSIPAEWLHLGATDNVLFDDFTSYTDANEIVPSVWLRRDGSGELTDYGNSTIASGGKALRIGNNSGNDEAWLVSARSIPFDPNATYRISAAIFQESGAGRVYIGVEGRAEDGITLVNRTGINTSGNQHNFAAQNVAPPIGQLTTYTGYFSGYGAPNATSGASPDIRNPGRVHANVRRIAPLIDLNYFQQSGVCYVDWVRLERLPDGYVETVVQAAEATDRLIKIGSDSLIAQEEKSSFIREVNALLTSADQTIIAANNVGLGAGNPAANWASEVTVRKNSLTNLLASYTTPSLWSDTTGDTNVNAVNLEYAIAELNSYIAQAQAAISTRASTTANWSGVNNDTGGKPEDFATNDRGVDTRYDNFLPSYYRTNWLRRWRMEFKLSSTIGAPSNYGDLHTYAGWQDDTGGPVIQRCETVSGTYWRRGTNASGWGAWAKSFDELNRPDFATSDILSGGVALRPGDVRNNAIVLSTDGTLSFNTGFGFVNLGSILINQVPGKITGTQIADNAITTPLLAANVVTGDKLAANNLITLSAQIGVGVIQAANIGSLSASVINAGLLDARRLSLDGATIEPDASGVLRVKNAGVGTDQLAAGALVQPVSINAVGTLNLTQNGWATAYLSGSFVQLTVNNAAPYPGIVKLDVTAYLYQSGTGSDEVTMRVYYSGANVGSVGPMDVSGGSTRLNSIPATFTDSIPANTTRTYFIEFYSNDQTVLRQITASAQLFKRT